jgi:hypothetical protein
LTSVLLLDMNLPWGIRGRVVAESVEIC